MKAGYATCRARTCTKSGGYAPRCSLAPPRTGQSLNASTSAFKVFIPPTSLAHAFTFRIVDTASPLITRDASATFRFAHTAPFHIEIAGRPLRPRPAEIDYLIR